MAYAGLEHADLVKLTGIKLGTLRNVMSKTRPNGGSPARLTAIAAACKVPPKFMTVGFEPLRAPIDHVTRDLYALRADVDRRLTALETDRSLGSPAEETEKAASRRIGKKPAKPAQAPSSSPRSGQVA